MKEELLHDIGEGLEMLHNVVGGSAVLGMSLFLAGMLIGVVIIACQRYNNEDPRSGAAPCCGRPRACV